MGGEGEALLLNLPFHLYDDEPEIPVKMMPGNVKPGSSWLYKKRKGCSVGSEALDWGGAE